MTEAFFYADEEMLNDRMNSSTRMQYDVNRWGTMNPSDNVTYPSTVGEARRKMQDLE